VNSEAEALLSPYVPRLAAEWLETVPGEAVRVLEGTLAFVDISGFTRLTEILAGRGKAGAEEMTGYLDFTFGELLDIAYANGGELIKWGGDAVLLWYTGDGHAARAVEAAWRMQRTMSRIGRLRTSAGRATLRMSVGIHSGLFHFFSIGRLHRELIVTGPSATRTAHLEAVAEAGEIVISPETAALLEPGVTGAAKEDGLLVDRPPRRPVHPEPTRTGPAGRPSRSLPASLKEFLVAAPIESEHRQISVAFVEFSGVDRLLAEQGESALAAALEDFFSTVQEACARHRVTFWETDIAENGGKVMLVAGAPSATEDDAGTILVTVRDIVDTADRLRIRGGVNCGWVFTGGFGPPYRRTYSAKGDAINLAARLMGRSGAGEVFASDAVVNRSRVGFVTEKLEPFLVKGKVHPVHAHRVISARSGRRSISPEGPPLVGREKELLFLADLIDSAVAGRGSCVEVSGPPGIGKSRIVSEAEIRAGACRSLAVVCDEYGVVAPYASMRTFLRQVLAIDLDEGPQLSGARLQVEVGRRAPELGPWLPLLAPVVGAEVEPTPESSALDERFRQQRLAETVVQLLAAELPSPTLMLVEDAQWMDDASVALFRHLAGALSDHPWLLMVARRPSATGLRLRELPGVETMELGPLTEEASVQLLRSVTSDHPLAPHHRDTVASRSGGNPLFLLELLDAGLQSGFEAAMPDTVEGVFASQIDRLAPRDRRLLRVASVLGMQVAVDVLNEIAGNEPIDVRPLLGDFLTREGPDALRFRHTMLRDAAYGGLAYSRRRELHALAGSALERRAEGNKAEVAGLLAVHFEHAGDYAAAWRYARLAAERAAALHASVEAATFFDRALQAGRMVRDVPTGDLLSVAEALGDARTHLGEFAAAEQSYRVARRWASEALDRSRLQYKAALATDRSGNYRRTLQLLTRAARYLDDAAGEAVLRQRAEIRAQYGLVRHRQGRGHDAVRLLQEAVKLATDAGAPDVLANALLHLDTAELTAGMTGDGAHARRALEIQSQLGDNPWLEARALNQLGIRAYFAGRWADAVAYYSDSRAACERAGDRWTAAVESANIAEVLADQGHLADAEPVLQEALDTYRAAGTRTFVADGTRLLGRLAARRGDPELSRQLLAAARGIYESDGEALQVNLTDAILAESLLRAGEAETAAELARRVLQNVGALPGRHLVAPMVQRVLGVALRGLGMDSEEARRALEESIQLARRHDSRYELALSLQAISELWPTDVSDAELMERDTLFHELGVLDGARRILPSDLPVAGV
jgi:predicted ATPase/class 3 adenylate cyclase